MNTSQIHNIEEEKSAELYVEHETILYEVWDNTLNRVQTRHNSTKNSKY